VAIVKRNYKAIRKSWGVYLQLIYVVFFSCQAVYWLEFTILKVNKWDVWGSNPGLCI